LLSKQAHIYLLLCYIFIVLYCIDIDK
jgi:hypothetical protein